MFWQTFIRLSGWKNSCAHLAERHPFRLTHRLVRYADMPPPIPSTHKIVSPKLPIIKIIRCERGKCANNLMFDFDTLYRCVPYSLTRVSICKMNEVDKYYCRFLRLCVCVLSVSFVRRPIRRVNISPLLIQKHRDSGSIWNLCYVFFSSSFLALLEMLS